MPKLSHVDRRSHPQMVDVGGKSATLRIASARGFIRLARATLELIARDAVQKGNVLVTAELAGIQAAKRTHEIIPLCHLLPLTQVTVKARACPEGIEVTAQATYTGCTGVEMEALTAVSAALLTVYDMVKAVDKKMVIEEIKLLKKEKLPILTRTPPARQTRRVSP